VAAQAQEERLVARAGDLEKDPALLLQGDLPVVQEPRNPRHSEVVAHLVNRNAPEGRLIGTCDWPEVTLSLT
jgi:hypothetical protein